MDSYPKYTNIHINPSFNDTMKSVIHINPKMHGNMAIHVNPKIVNTLHSTELQQHLLQRKFNEQVTGTYNTNKNNIQKSVYVNPKLMIKLQNKVTQQTNQVQKQTSIQPQINPVINKPLEIQKNTNNLCQNSLSSKYISPNFVALSKNKLVRVNSDAKKNSIKSINYQGKTTLHTVKKINTSKKLVNVNTAKKLVNIDTTKKLVNVNTAKKLINIDTTRKLVNVNSKNLSKPKELTSKNTKYKIDRTVISKSKNKTNLSSIKLLPRNSNLINIDGVLYKSSKSCLVRSTNSSTSSKRSSLGSTKLNTSLTSLKNKKLRRQSSIGKSTKLNVSLKNNTTGQKLNYKHVISNRVKQRSLQILRHKMCKNNQPCLLYQRFGYCAKYIDGICPKVHDKKQVALCKNFLQGKCLLDNCPLSHEVGPEKMPTCKYFLDGCCTRDACQYLHVKVSDNTSICVQFLRGYCAKGNKCKERHTNVCPDFDKTGKCPKGKNCPYPHKSSLLAQQKTFKVHKNINLIKSKKSNIITDKNTETIDNSSRDDNLKRYYDESDCNDENNIEKKRLKLNNTMKLIASIHGETSNDNVDNLQSLSSIDLSNNDYEKPKRPPIGPLPSYIPIN